MKLRAWLTLSLVGLVVCVFGTPSAEASVSRDVSRSAFSSKTVGDSFATAPTLSLPSISDQLKAIDAREIKASACVALCELAASIEAHPLGRDVPLYVPVRTEGFTGHYWDNEAGLYYAKARYYDPFTARFTQADSFLGSIDSPPSLHRYFYANDNPTRYVDLTGHAGSDAAFRHRAISHDELSEPEKQVAAFNSGALGALWDAGVGAVKGVFKAAEISAKLNYGTMEQRADALRQLRDGVRGGATEVKERLSLTAQGLSDPAQLADTCAQLGQQGCARQVGRIVAEIDMALPAGKAALDLASKGWSLARNARASVEAAEGSAAPSAVAETMPSAPSSGAPRVASGEVRFKRWSRGDAIDKPLPDGSSPSWDVVRERYWKNRYEASKGGGEFSAANLEKMRRGNAPADYNPRTGAFEERELHHVIGQQYGGPNAPLNLRELTPDWHAEVDPFRIRAGVSTTRGIR